MTFAYSPENDRSRECLTALIRRLTDTDLALSTEYGWTISALLAHIAFWDLRVLAILKRWKEQGFDASPIDSGAVNEALKPICHALEPRSAAHLAMLAADEIDAELATLSPDLVKQIEAHAEATSTQFRMNRALHRNDHIKDIEALLNR